MAVQNRKSAYISIFCLCSLEVTVTSLHPPRLCRIAVFSVNATFLSSLCIGAAGASEEWLSLIILALHSRLSRHASFPGPVLPVDTLRRKNIQRKGSLRPQDTPVRGTDAKSRRHSGLSTPGCLQLLCRHLRRPWAPMVAQTLVSHQPLLGHA